MMGPTISGMEILMAKDPHAYWDDDLDKGHQQFAESACFRFRCTTLTSFRKAQNGRTADLISRN